MFCYLGSTVVLLAAFFKITPFMYICYWESLRKASVLFRAVNFNLSFRVTSKNCRVISIQLLADN